jgi:hypothetical protein
MIDPTFLAALRRRHRAEMVLVLVQLEQLAPGWWESLIELAELLGTDRATLNRSLVHLERHDLIRRVSVTGLGPGTWIWWVKRHADDQPPSTGEPAWLLRDLIHGRALHRVTLSDRYAWADRHKIPRNTMRSFLAGNQRVMRGRWELAGHPWEL